MTGRTHKDAGITISSRWLIWILGSPLSNITIWWNILNLSRNVIKTMNHLLLIVSQCVMKREIFHSICKRWAWKAPLCAYQRKSEVCNCMLYMHIDIIYYHALICLIHTPICTIDISKHTSIAHINPGQCDRLF